MYYRVKRLIPRRVQLAARRGLIAWRGNPDFPRWPHDDSVERLAGFYGACVLRALRCSEVSFRWFWPNGYRAAAILTHDIEGVSGMRNALRVAEIEERHGLRSSFNVVGDWYPIDWGVLRELSARGHEIGSHALHHDRSLFSSRAEFERQLPLLRSSVAQLGARGFRSPATHRVPEWFAELPVDYDLTMPLSDPYEAQPGGTCSAWPFFVGNVLEMPYTLPQDHTLFTLMGRRDPSLWVDQMRRVKRSFGLIQCLSHPDADYLADQRNESSYREFLDALRSHDDVWHALPRDVSRWWRARAAGESLPGLALVRGRLVTDHSSNLAVIRPPQR
ncbi:MAG: polysaccharide deacetylase family protein [Solirubrobacterales bacterium]|nr:polysaccharide deacetylase family protein [Solirubrobacterales bacterium]